jgi:DNA polymerase-3 subunit alpha
MQAAAERQRDRKAGQLSLFESAAAQEEGGTAPAVGGTLPDVPPWSEKDQLKFEKEVIDIYLTSHPLAQFAKELQRHSSHTADQVPLIQPGTEVTFGGMITQLRLKHTERVRNGNSLYMRCKIEDFSGAAECVMWPDSFARYKDAVQEDRICFGRGILERQPGKDPIVVLSQVLSVEQMQKESCSEVWLRLRLSEHKEQWHLIDRIAPILKRYPGTCPVRLSVFDFAGKQCQLRLDRQFNVNPLALCAAEIEDLLGPGSVKLVGSSNGRNGR